MKRRLILIGCLLSLLITRAAETGSLTIKATGFESNQGQALIVLYKGPDGFPRELSKAWKRVTAKITKKQAVFQIPEVPKGDYAALVVHDADGNNKLSRSFIGIPNESIGLSNYTQFSRPKFDRAQFKITANTETKLEIPVWKPKR